MKTDAEGRILRTIGEGVYGVSPLANEDDDAYRSRVRRAVGRVCRLGTPTDFAEIADDALVMHAPVALDLATSRRFVVFAWVRQLTWRGPWWARLLGRVVVWGFARLSRGMR